jgi:hypothetical protein
MHDCKLVSCDEQDGAHAVGGVTPTTVSDSDIQTVIELCTSFFSTFNSVVNAMQSQRATQPPMRMSA